MKIFRAFPSLGLLQLTLFFVAGCGEDTVSDNRGVMVADHPRIETEVEFGVDHGDISRTAEELLGKPASNPDPETVVGVFERTGYVTGVYNDDFERLSNNWRVRHEHRQDAIGMAIECEIDVVDFGGGDDNDEQTLRAFVMSPVKVSDFGIEILGAKKAGEKYTKFGFDTDCSIEITPLMMPFCTKAGNVPDGYSLCLTVRSGRLLTVSASGSETELGKKIAN